MEIKDRKNFKKFKKCGIFSKLKEKLRENKKSNGKKFILDTRITKTIQKMKQRITCLLPIFKKSKKSIKKKKEKVNTKKEFSGKKQFKINEEISKKPINKSPK